MELEKDHINEGKVALAFSSQSVIFDIIYGSNAIINYKRERVRQQVIHLVKPGSHILELNSGTGEDAIFFAQNGYTVHATDISSGMQERLNDKICNKEYKYNISTELCSFTQLDQLKNKGPYDLIFSNFGGLNCTGDLDIVLNYFDDLLKPGGKVCLVVISKFCLWELLLLFKGKLKTATRRFFSKSGRKAHIEGNLFTCWYYAPGYIQKKLKNYQLSGIEGLCTIVPPSYLEGFAEKYPKFYSFLRKKEGKLKTKWPWKYIGDYFIISLKKN